MSPLAELPNSESTEQMSDESNNESIDDDLAEIRADFVAECREVIQDIEPTLVRLDSETDPAVVSDALAKVFRLFHSVKGSAGFLGLDQVVRVTHVTESLLPPLRQDPSRLSPQHVTEFCAAIDTLTTLLDAVDSTGTDASVDVDHTVERLQALLAADAERLEGGSSAPAAAPAAEAEAAPAAPEAEAAPAAPEAEAAPAAPETTPTPEEAPAPPASQAQPEPEIPPETWDAFAAEAAEQLEQVEAFGLQLEGGKSDSEMVDAAFRSIHTFKGNCGFLGLADAESVAMALEDVFEELRNGATASPTEAQLVLRTVDVLRRGTCQSGVGPVPIGEAPQLVEELRKSRSGQPAPTPAPAPAPATKAPVSAAAAATVAAASAAAAAVASGDAAATPSLVPTPGRPAPAAPDAKAPDAKAPPAAKTTKFIRVDIRKLDALLAQVGELITTSTSITQNEAFQSESLEHLQQPAALLNRVTSGLHDTAMAMRMVPLGTIFRKMLRVVRDVSTKVGKKVELQLEGEDTEVDKTVIEALADPLVHMIRNSVDHGIESADARAKAGKSDTGTIVLSAKHQGGEVWITIGDDGGGIDSSRLIAKAQERGLVGEEANEYTDKQAYQLLFMAGLSTAKQVTGISGRGVGMDVVRRNLEAIRGRVDVASQLGKGTTFTVRIPLTLAIIDAMLAKVGDRLYAFPVLSIRASVRVDPALIVRLPDGTECLRVRDRVIEIIRIHQYHAIEGSRTDLPDGILVILEDAGETRAIFVDEIIGQRQIVIKALEPFLGSIRGVSGCSVTGTGEITLVVDPHDLIRGDHAASEAGEAA